MTNFGLARPQFSPDYCHSFCKIINPSIVSLMAKKNNVTQVNLKWNKWNQYLFLPEHYFIQVSYFHLSKYKVATSVQVLSL